jgi:serine/threonine protein kinase
VISNYTYITFPYYPKGDLYAIFKKARRYPDMYDEQTKVYLSYQMLVALNVLHEECKLAHRDFKLENLVLTNEYIVGIIDNSQCTGVDVMSNEDYVGTDGYLAPEVYDLDKEEGDEYHPRKIDIFALGVCLVMIYL